MDWIAPILAEQLGVYDWEIPSILGKFEVVEFRHRGVVTGVAVLAGCEIHFLVHPEHRGRAGSRASILSFLEEMLARFGYLTTRIPIHTPPKDRTGERLGFVKTWGDDDYDYYMLTELPFARRKHAAV